MSVQAGVRGHCWGTHVSGGIFICALALQQSQPEQIIQSATIFPVICPIPAPTPAFQKSIPMTARNPPGNLAPYGQSDQEGCVQRKANKSCTTPPEVWRIPGA
ncbi:hypothetical protein DPEC_G00082250 [Dallia pectoralis]|uniref:Uncharacterized protein n=1 Tax=Dallia pectoralis TaxID=75939 RepID=A0ACC2GYQ5_DALPE|nr:hypothetical protein DPEC_G00082250 [Dallia pectoralis]